MDRKSLFGVAILCLVIFAPARAERVILRNGGQRQGSVTDLGDKIRIDSDSGSVILDRADVLRIEPDAPASHNSHYQRREKQLSPRDTKGLYRLARWAHKQGDATRAREIMREIISLDPDHKRARRFLGFVPLDSQWLDADEALKRIEGLLAAGKVQQAGDDLEKVLKLNLDNPNRLRCRSLQWRLALARGRFDLALGVLENQLADTKDPRLTALYQTRIRILKQNPDGMVLITDDSRAARMLFGHSSEPVHEAPGPKSLTAAETWTLAQRRHARIAVRRGAAALRRATRQSARDTAAWVAAVREADDRFQYANCLIPGLAKSFQAEAAALRITMLRKEAAQQANRFDAERQTLPTGPVPKASYLRKVARMIRHLTVIREKLTDALDKAKPFPVELADNIDAMKSELDYIDVCLETLLAEQADMKE